MKELKFKSPNDALVAAGLKPTEIHDTKNQLCCLCKIKPRKYKNGYCHKCNLFRSNTRFLQKSIEKTGMSHCAICNATAKIGKKFTRHHIDYAKDIVILLCFVCHGWIHGQHAYWHPFNKQYGKDKAVYIFAKKIIEIYDKYLKEEKND